MTSPGGKRGGRSTVRRSELDRVVKTLLRAGVPISGAEISPDGIVKLIGTNGSVVRDSDAAMRAWEQRNEAKA